MQLDQIRTDIKKRRKNDESYQSIANDLGINKAMVQYIETHPHYKPSKEIARKLGIVSDKLLATRARRATLDEIAKDRGYASWSAYETAQIKEWKEWKY